MDFMLSYYGPKIVDYSTLNKNTIVLKSSHDIIPKVPPKLQLHAPTSDS